MTNTRWPRTSTRATPPPLPQAQLLQAALCGFLETRSGDEFLRGVGVNYNVPRNEELAVRLLAETGFKTFRIEIGWGSIKWDESGVNNAEHFLLKVLKLCKQYGVRPTMLLNAHHGMPCPAKLFTKPLAEDAPAGSKSIRLADTDGVSVRTGPMDPAGHTTPGSFFTSVDRETGECRLSKPLAKAMKKGDPIKLATLKYAPLYPPGTKEFDETATGWAKYASVIADLVEQAGIDEFDLEMWNELSFGSSFVNVNNYYDPPLFEKKQVPDFLHTGGSAWEMTRRAIEVVKKAHPKVRVVWGWSNTTFYHCPVDQLPPGTDGQSYHPYGTGTRKLPDEEPHKDHPEFNAEGFVPHTEFRTPEGWAHLFIKTEGLMRLLNPKDRAQTPAGRRAVLPVHDRARRRPAGVRRHRRRRRVAGQDAVRDAVLLLLAEQGGGRDALLLRVGEEGRRVRPAPAGPGQAAAGREVGRRCDAADAGDP